MLKVRSQIPLHPDEKNAFQRADSNRNRNSYHHHHLVNINLGHLLTRSRLTLLVVFYYPW